MLFGNPSTNYWNELGIESFDDSIVFSFGFFDYPKWMNEFPAKKYPVIALKGKFFLYKHHVGKIKIYFTKTKLNFIQKKTGRQPNYFY